MKGLLDEAGPGRMGGGRAEQRSAAQSRAEAEAKAEGAGASSSERGPRP